MTEGWRSGDNGWKADDQWGPEPDGKKESGHTNEERERERERSRYGKSVVGRKRRNPDRERLRERESEQSNKRERGRAGEGDEVERGEDPRRDGEKRSKKPWKEEADLPGRC